MENFYLCRIIFLVGKSVIEGNVLCNLKVFDANDLRCMLCIAYKQLMKMRNVLLEYEYFQFNDFDVFPCKNKNIVNSIAHIHNLLIPI